MRDIAGCLCVVVFFTEHDANRVLEAANVDEPKVESKKYGSGYEPNDDQLQLSAADIDRNEDEIGHCFGDRAERRVDRSVYVGARYRWD